MHAAHSPTLRRVRSISSRSLTMSAMASRPPGRSAAAAERKTASLSGARLITPLEITTSIDAASTGGSSISPLTKTSWAMWCSSRSRRAFASCASVMSTPMTRPAEPVRWAAMNESVPEPEPRSMTLSPGWMRARSSMWPTPANEASAAAGTASSHSAG
jgi:hypothetical protein